MKNFRVLFALLAITAFMTACQKDNIAELDALQTSESEATVSNNGPIEYLSLEELNQLSIEHGLEPTTLEEIGVTQEMYDAAQARLNDPSLAKSRCSGRLTLRWLDINGSGTFTGLDLVRARLVILQRWPESKRSDDFGYANVIWPRPQDRLGFPFNPDPALSSHDIVEARKIILGIYGCH